MKVTRAEQVLREAGLSEREIEGLLIEMFSTEIEPSTRASPP